MYAGVKCNRLMKFRDTVYKESDFYFDCLSIVKMKHWDERD